MVQPKSLLYLVATPLVHGFVIPISNSTEAVSSALDATSTLPTSTDLPTSTTDDAPPTASTSDISLPTDDAPSASTDFLSPLLVISPGPTDIPDGDDSSDSPPNYTPTPIYDSFPLETPTSELDAVTDPGSVSTVYPTPDYGSSYDRDYASGGYGFGCSHTTASPGPSPLEILSEYAHQTLDTFLLLVDYVESAIYGAPYQMEGPEKEKVERVKEELREMKNAS